MIDVGTADMTVTALIERGGGGEMQGVVGRHSGSSDWIMAFYDGVGDLVLGAKVSSRGGAFEELGRIPVEIDSDSDLSLSLVMNGTSISVELDDDQVLPAKGSAITFADHTNVATAGIFLRGNGSSKFDEFTVTTDHLDICDDD